VTNSGTIVYREVVIVTAVAELGTLASVDMTLRYSVVRVPVYLCGGQS